MIPARGIVPLKASDVLKPLMEIVGNPFLILEAETLRLLQLNQKAAALFGSLESPDHIFDQASIECLRKVTPQAGTTRKRIRLLPALREADVDVLAVEAEGRSILFLTIHSGVAEAESHLFETEIDFPCIIGKSEGIRDVCRLIGLVAKTDTTVLVQGESGTGKEIIAQAVHSHSHRARGPVVKVNCAALTETLLESELFGHKKGSFTGAIQDRKGRFKLADGGTIVLDEIGSMSLAGQAKLLRVLQEKEFEAVGDSVTVKVDVRVIAMTNANLVKLIDQGNFREDLYYRLNAFPIQLPPIRERKVDIPLLARHFLREYSRTLKKDVSTIDPRAVSMLMDYPWPGNVRELENAIEYSVILEKGTSLTADSLPEKLDGREKKESLKQRLELLEKQMILEALSATDWMKNRAANLLGIDRRNLSYFLHKHGID
jgi:transcriptional regulator with PAS, ATPase and Fis domain